MSTEVAFFETPSNFFKRGFKMIQYERKLSIIDYLEKNRLATVKELARAVYTSEASVRRDIAELEQSGHVEKVYGGVLLTKYKSNIIPARLRDSENHSAKDAIAEKAVKLIQSGDTVMMDASTTVFRMCKYMKGIKNLKIITNNLRVCGEFTEGDSIKVYCTGGAYSPRNSCFLGAYAESFIKTVNADILFFSAQGMADDGVISDVDENEVSMRKVMLAQAKRKVFLCDSSKMGISKPFKVCDKNEINEIITEK